MAEIPTGLSRETAIRRDAEGRWFDGEAPIEHRGIIRAFETWLDRAEDGRYILKNSANWAYVAIEGAPMVVKRAYRDRDQIELDLSGDRRERLVTESLRQDRDGRIYCDVRGGRFVAIFSRQAGFDIGEWMQDGASGPELQLGARTFPVPSVADPLVCRVTDS